MATLNKIVAVIDDDESIARAIKRLLRSVGIKAESFSSGEEFLGTARRSPAAHSLGSRRRPNPMSTTAWNDRRNAYQIWVTTFAVADL
jgi:DNA-binding NtrC family response regulator